MGDRKARRNAVRLTRRQFAAAVTVPLVAHAASPKPNILWITCEDTGQQLGCYGDSFATTPNLDRLASRSLIYRYAWSNAPVCAPARTCLISGMYATSTGSEHMRSMASLPASMRMYPQFLRDAGYYVTNNSKEDYNLEKPGQVWDDSSARAHWRNRKPGQPFFAIFNFTISHESQIRRRPHKLVHDPEKVRIPAYHPDTPEVRHDWSQYYDNITTVDGQAGGILRQLEEDGLAADTIVVFYGDHGSGMPRSKRWPYNSGLQVPVIVYIPPKFAGLAPQDYRPGAKSNRMVSFVDLAPTLLSLAGLRPPEWMQGRAFLGTHIAPEPDFLFGFRGRMDERYDLVRSVRDRRYIYIRNYMPHRIYGQHIAYMFETPTTRVWKDLYDKGALEPPKSNFWEPKPAEELYDLESDPDEVVNLASSPKHRQALERLRKALRGWLIETRDVGFLPEDEIHRRSKGSTPYEMGHNERAYPMKKILETAEFASVGGTSSMLLERLKDSDSAVRYWAATGLLIGGAKAYAGAGHALLAALQDPAPCVRVPAAEALVRFGADAERSAGLAALLELSPADKNTVFISILALNALDALGEKAAPIKEKLKLIPTESASAPARVREGYVKNLLAHILAP